MHKLIIEELELAVKQSNLGHYKKPLEYARYLRESVRVIKNYRSLTNTWKLICLVSAAITVLLCIGILILAHIISIS